MSTDRQGRSGLGLDAQKDAVQQRLNGGRWQRLFADLPELNGAMGRFMLTTVASVPELEAGLISERTKVALKAAGARGVKAGKPQKQPVAIALSKAGKSNKKRGKKSC